MKSCTVGNLKNNKQQTTNNKQQTTNNKQQTTNNKQQTTNNNKQQIGMKAIFDHETAASIIAVAYDCLPTLQTNNERVLVLELLIGISCADPKGKGIFKVLKGFFNF